MTTVSPDVPVSPGVRTAWTPIAAVAAGYAVLVQAFAGRYGLTPDEMYFRMLGERPAWGYVDQPPLLPLLARGSAAVFGDTAFGMRVPALLCGIGVIFLIALITAELGGTRRAQVLAAAAAGTSTLVLSVGHFLLTTSVDVLASTAVLLCALRALRRGEGRWWLVAGVICGVALYGKYIVLLVPAALVLGLLIVGPRPVLRDRWLWLGVAATLVIGAPNLVFQAANGWPQLEMAEALAAADGEYNRAAFLPNLVVLLGPALTPIWVAGLVGLFRRVEWRAVRALAVAYLVVTVLAFAAEGGRSDYTAGLLVGLFAAGCVVTDQWLSRRNWHKPVLYAVVSVFAVLQVLLALPVLPEEVFARYPIASLSVETVGWQKVVDQVADVHSGLPANERDNSVLLAENFGEAGALHWLGRERGLPKVHSGHNELYKWGPPPDDAPVVIAVGLDSEQLRTIFASCTVAARIDNGLELESKEQGRSISVCRDPRAPWTELWPSLRHLGGY